MTLEEEINQKILEEFEKYKKSVQKPNILLAGGTGVGKSSLINKIFGKELAKTGMGKPITDSIQKYEDYDIGVVLFDSPGYEIGTEKAKKFEDDVINIKENIHLVWYCIDASGHKVTDFDINTIKRFRENGLIVSILFTKCDLVSEDTPKILKETINKEICNINMYETSYVLDDIELKSELDRLINDSILKLPDIVKDGFISAQKVSLKEKWNRAHGVILQHAGGAFGVGFTPIPFSDAPILIANQMGMIARILYIYDLKSLENMLKAGGGSGVIGQIMSMLGKSAVGQLLKFIPGVGTLLGGVINASVATILTSALGEAVSAGCYQLYEAILNGNTDIEEQVKAFADIVFKFAKEAIESKKGKDDYQLPE